MQEENMLKNEPGQQNNNIKEQEIIKWGKNLQHFVKQIEQGGCTKEEIPRHCYDFIISVSGVFRSQLLQEIEERVKKGLEEMKKFTPPDRRGNPMFTYKDVTAPHNRGWNSAISQAITLIETIINSFK